MFLIDRRVMQPSFTSLKTYLVGLVGAVALAVLAVAGVAIADAPEGVVVTTVLVVLAGIMALAVWIRRRIETHLRDLAAAAGQIAPGEIVTVRAGIREGDVLAASLAGIAETLNRRAAEVEESRERYKTLAESLPALVWIMALDGRTVFQNRRVASYAGGSQQADQEARSAFTHPDDLPLLREARATSARDTKEYQMEIRLRRHDGVYRWHLVTTAPLTFPVVADDQTY